MVEEGEAQSIGLVSNRGLQWLELGTATYGAGLEVGLRVRGTFDVV